MSGARLIDNARECIERAIDGTIPQIRYIKGSALPTGTDIVFDIWRSHPGYLGDRSIPLPAGKGADALAKVFCPGPFFCYVLDSQTLTFEQVSPSLVDLLGIEPKDFTVAAFMDILHPEDLDFFLRCEDVVAHFLKHQITADQVVNYKISSCLRHRVSDGSYRLFLKQTVTLKTTTTGALLKVFGTHTDISHITTVNNRQLSFIGLNGAPSYLGLDVFSDQLFEGFEPFRYSLADAGFTRREIEIIKLLGLGYSTEQIAHTLHISRQTVLTHRRNVLRKSGAENTIKLVADCIRKGII